MKNLIITLFLISSSNIVFGQSIEGKWIFEIIPGQQPNTMYEFKDGLRYTYYCDDFVNGCDDVYWNSLETTSAIPNPHSYTFINDTLTIDVNFGNYWIQQVSFECDSDVIYFGNPDFSNWWRVGANLDSCEGIDSCIANPIEGCFTIDIWDPVCGCDGVTYSNSGYAACNSIYDFTDGECIPVDDFICTSNSGIEIIEVGYWENPNDPCETGECTSDSQFVEIVIDCMEEMGIPCNGEWVEVEGQCCSECIETTIQYCDSISLNPILPLAASWDLIDSLLVTLETSFASYSIPYAGLMLLDFLGDTIAIETFSSAGNVYGIGPNMSETRNLTIVNELILPFTGELCVVQGLFAGTPNIVCSYPVMWESIGLNEIVNEGPVKLIKMIDILGREHLQHQSGQLLFYVFNNGKVEKHVKY